MTTLTLNIRVRNISPALAKGETGSTLLDHESFEHTAETRKPVLAAAMDAVLDRFARVAMRRLVRRMEALSGLSHAASSHVSAITGAKPTVDNGFSAQWHLIEGTPRTAHHLAIAE